MSRTILQVLPSLHSGGVERGTIEIAACLVNNGYGSIVCSSGGDLVERLAEVGSQHIYIPFDRKNPLSIISNTYKLLDILNKEQVSIIHARSRAPAWSAYLATRVKKIPFVTTFHGLYSEYNWIKHIYNGVMLKADKVIAVSNFAKDHILRHYNVNTNLIEVINRGVDLNYFSINIAEDRMAAMRAMFNIPEGATIIASPGRITRRKGQLCLLQTLVTLMNEHNLFALIVGSNKGHEAYSNELVNFINNNNLTDRVVLADTIEDMPALYAISDLVILPNLEPESFGRVIVEAQAIGKMVITTAIGCAVETVTDEQTGWLVPPNDVQALARKIKYVIALHPSKKAEIARQAMANVTQKYSMQHMCTKTMDLYNGILNAHMT
jgi:glycosyltransferase involved in cell wall biosynthesis